MTRLIVGLFAASLGCSLLAAASASAQDGCAEPARGVDLAVQSARLRQREEGWVVLYTVANRGPMTSTSYHVSLVVDGATVGKRDDYDVGLEPGHRRRWELHLPDDNPSPDGHDVAVRVMTAGEGSAAGPSYTDQCGLNDVMPASQRTITIQGRRVSTTDAEDEAL
jgi:hypothetical protein